LAAEHQLGVGAPDDVLTTQAHRVEPAAADQQVAAVRVLDRDQRGRVVEDALQAVSGHAEILLAGAERGGHVVERLGQQRDLAAAGDAHAGVALPVGQASGRDGDAADGTQDGHVEVEAEQEQDERTAGRAGGGDHDRAVAALLGARAAHARQALLGAVEAVEREAQRVEPALAVLARGDHVGVGPEETG
jgi:hypothetical protein